MIPVQNTPIVIVGGGFAGMTPAGRLERTAQFAVQQAPQLAENLSCVLRGERMRPFPFRPRGLLAVIGYRNAVAEIHGLKFSGFFAWMLWRGAYLWKLPTFGRKVQVAFGWMWNAWFAPNLVQFRGLGRDDLIQPKEPV